MHPHAKTVKATNVTKMRAITGKGGAGTAYMGHSPFKRANKHGEQESFNSHSKGFEAGYAHGGKVKARGDRTKRGDGKVTKDAWGTKGITRPEGAMDVHKDNSRILHAKTKADLVPDEGFGAAGLMADGGKAEEYGAFKPSFHEGQTEEAAEKTGAKYASGGRSMGRGKHKGDVNIVIMQRPPVGGGLPGGLPKPPMGAGMPPSPSPTPPPSGAPGGAPAPQINPQALAQIAGGGGGLGGLKATGGRIRKADGGGIEQRDNNANQDAPWMMSGGQKATRTGLKEGGRAEYGKGADTRTTKGTGRKVGKMPENAKHWSQYSNQNRHSNRGNTGESQELSLATPGYKVTEGGTTKGHRVGDADKRARGGRLKGTGITGGAGQQTGEARLAQYRKGIF